MQYFVKCLLLKGTTHPRQKNDSLFPEYNPCQAKKMPIVHVNKASPGKKRPIVLGRNASPAKKRLIVQVNKVPLTKK